MFGLAIEAVTPGSAPPLASAARPVIVAVAVCASASAGRNISASRQTPVRRTHTFPVDFISQLLEFVGVVQTSNAGVYDSASCCGRSFLCLRSQCGQRMRHMRWGTYFTDWRLLEVAAAVHTNGLARHEVARHQEHDRLRDFRLSTPPTKGGGVRDACGLFGGEVRRGQYRPRGD